MRLYRLIIQSTVGEITYYPDPEIESVVVEHHTGRLRCIWDSVHGALDSFEICTVGATWHGIEGVVGDCVRTALIYASEMSVFASGISQAHCITLKMDSNVGTMSFIFVNPEVDENMEKYCALQKVLEVFSQLPWKEGKA